MRPGSIVATVVNIVRVIEFYRDRAARQSAAEKMA
jgi:hypothetical protein